MALEKKEEIRRLKNKISQFKGQITRAAKYATEQAGQVLVEQEGIQLRLELLQQSLSSYKETKLELSLISKDDENFEDDDIEERCFSIMSQLRAILRIAEISEDNHKKKLCSSSPTSSVHSNRLPPVEIACFDGKDITLYSNFMEMFKAVIDKDDSLTAVQKLYYLKRYLRGEALTLIDSLPLTDESYAQAVKLLTDRYDNKSLLITHHINALVDHQPISRGTANELRHIVSMVRQHTGALQTLGQKVEHWDMLIICIMSRKLDSLSRRLYISERDPNKLPTLQGFLQFLEKRAMSFEESQIANGKSSYDTYSNKFAKSSNLANINHDKPSSGCRFCQSNEHKLFTCKKYQALSATDRIQFATDHDLCQICLNKHDKKCHYHFKCTLCKSKDHNTLLHRESLVTNLVHSGNNLIPETMVLLPTIKVKFRTHDGSYITARGLVDSGSQVSFVHQTLVDQLNVPTFNYNVNVSALGQLKKPVNTAAHLSMHSVHDNYCCNALFSVVDNITSYLPQKTFDVSNIMSCIPDTINLADNDFNKSGEVSFLISADIFFNIMLPNKIALPGNDLFLLATKFGYIVSGNISNDHMCSSATNFKCEKAVLHATLVDENVDTLLQRFWEEQSIPEIKSQEGTVCQQDVCETVFQNSVQLIDNRFQVKMPLKVPIEEVHLGDSFSVALRRLNSLCKKFLKDNNLKERYTEFINEFLELDHAKVIDLFNLDKPLEYCYFMPHHAVLREDRVTTKLRTVFDASARTNLNRSLNDFLHSGPVVQRQLFEILLQFRTYKYIAMTDIKQMYRQVMLDPSQAHLQLILWKEHIDDPLICLQLTRVIYGVTCSGYLATRCLVELAHRYKEQYPAAAAALLDNTYCDDCLFGGSSLEEVTNTRDQLMQLAGLGSFEFHKWCANHPNLLLGIPSNKQYFKDRMDFNDSTLSIKALGLLLNIKTDQFVISQPTSELPPQWTKRSMLSFIGTFFDPLGLAGPLVTKAKEFLQKVWKENLAWDVCISGPLLSSWNLFISDLVQMKPIHVKRDLMVDGADHIDLIGYCDASFTACGACIYIRAIHGDKVYVNILCSKSKIASIKNKLTIPKHELTACVLLAKLYQKVRSVLHFRIFENCILFSDSRVALCWLQNPSTKDVYVKNRVLTIQALTGDCMWRHVSGSCNPADCLSRGVMPSELSSNMLWWHGPPEVQNVNFSANNNQEPFLCEELVDERHTYCNVIEEVIPISKISSLTKLQRIVCYIRRFINNCKLKKGTRNNSKCLSAREYIDSMNMIIKHVQVIHFSEEVDDLINGKQIKSNLKKLCLFLDSNELLRVGGRLDNANIPSAQKHPLVLPKKCNLTVLVIRNEHELLLHAGLKLTLSSLTRNYYIIGATTIVKSILNKCVPCFKFRAQRAEQLMSALPQDRVVQDRVFEKTGMDYCGPFSIKQSSLRRSIVTKGYVCIFVCFVTKCVHLELVSDLTTDSFLSALKRFCARRGLPKVLNCDNASTFRGANNQLKQLYDLFKSECHRKAVTDYCGQRGVEFRFIPSYSPSWGGLWEAAVKSAKYHFKRVIGNLILTFEQFNTVIVQVEAILNSRPITQFSSDDSDFTFLTPGHFLINQPMTAPPEPEITSNNVNVMRFWKKCTKVQQDFWRAWHKSYLSQLNNRPKWYQPKPDIVEGVLVLLIGENVSPLNWPVARVSKVFKGTDGRVRSVEVKTKNGSHKRTINKIAVLPIYD